MVLKHTVYDTDAHFKIDPITHMIKNESSNKNVLIQHDHNSERFTFEIPRMVDGHDMSKCDVVQIHYINIDSQDKNNTSKDAHDVDDLQISPDGDDVVICSWLIDGNATKYAGSLNFLVKFKCIGDDGSACYVWNTAIFSGIFVSPGIDNGEAITEDYSDVLEQWRKELYEGAEKTHYTERVQVLARTDLDGFLNYPNHLHLIEGQEYTVIWNGVEYVCTAVVFNGANMGLSEKAIGLGNLYAVDVPGVAQTNEPFTIGEFEGDPTVTIVAQDNSTTATISIYHNVTHKLDNKYLDLDWIPEKTGTVILPAQIARANNGLVSIEAIDAAYRVNGTKINVIIDGIPHYTEIKTDGLDIFANIEFGFNNTVNIILTDQRTFFLGKNLDGRTVEIWLADMVCNKIPVEYLPDGYGSGGSSAPSDWNAQEGESGHILNRPCYTEIGTGTVMTESGITLTEDGYFEAEAGNPVFPGEEYTVIWNGTEYKCVCLEMEDNGTTGQLLGNVGMLTGGDSTGEPFVIVFNTLEANGKTEQQAIIVPFDGSESLTISISGKTEIVHELDPKYIENALSVREEILKDYTDRKCADSLTYYTVSSSIDIQLGFNEDTVSFENFVKLFNSSLPVLLQVTIMGQRYYFRTMPYYTKTTDLWFSVMFVDRGTVIDEPLDIYLLRGVLTYGGGAIWHLSKIGKEGQQSE